MEDLEIDYDDMHGLDDFDDEDFSAEEFRESIDDNYLNEQLQTISPVNEDIEKENQETDLTYHTEGDLQHGFEVSAINLDAIMELSNNN